MMYPNPFYPQIPQVNQLQFNPHGIQQNLEQFTVIPVSSEEEARNAITNPLSTFLFVDCGSGKIYYKKMNSNGKSDFVVYSPVFNNVVADPITQVNARLENIEKILGGLDVQSIHGNAGGKQSVPVPQSAVAEQNNSNGTAEPTGVSNVATNDIWKKRR
jgi:hypothetical protein